MSEHGKRQNLADGYDHPEDIRDNIYADRHRRFYREPSLEQVCPMLSGAGACTGLRDHSGPHRWNSLGITPHLGRPYAGADGTGAPYTFPGPDNISAHCQCPECKARFMLLRAARIEETGE
jgi:hypothetical protein